MRYTFHLLILIICFFFYATTETFAATYYAATTGSDSNSGTTTAPFKTINKGASILKPGDTLLVKPGTYNEALISNIPSGNDWNTPVTIKAFDPVNRPLIQPPSGAIRVFHFGTRNGVGQHHIIVDGFVLDAFNVTYDAVKITYDGADSSKAANHIRLINTEIKNSHSQGILITSPSAQYNEFINLDVHQNGTTDFDHGIYIAAPNNLVEHSSFYDNAGWGIHIYDGNYPNENTINTIVRFNKSYNNARVGNRGVGIVVSSGDNIQVYNNIIQGNNVGIWVDTATNAKILNNTLYNNTKNNSGYGNILINTQTKGTIIENNIIMKHTAYGIYNLAPAGSNTIVKNNLFYQNAAGDIRDTTGGLTASNNISGQDPRFVNLTNADFHLQATSPAIDKGIPLSQVINDFDGITRPQGTAYDIGAYEYKSTSSTSTPTQIPATVTSTPRPTNTLSPTPTPKPGDANGDLKIDGIDYIIWLNHYNQTTSNKNKDGDFNSDAKVDGVDYIVWLTNYGK